MGRRADPRRLPKGRDGRLLLTIAAGGIAIVPPPSRDLALIENPSETLDFYQCSGCENLSI